MSRKAEASILTANDLVSGGVIFWTGSDWSPEPAAATVLTDPKGQAEALAHAQADGLRAVDPYLAAVNGNGFLRLRERIRTTGPSIAVAPDRFAFRKA